MRQLILASLWGIFPCFVAAQGVGEKWTVNTTDDEAYYAATTNDSGSVFGQWCYLQSGNCLYLIGLTTSCEKGSSYPVLANSDAGSEQLKLLCTGPVPNSKNFHALAFDNFDAIDSLVRKASRIGIAIPLKDGTFEVYRFGLIRSNVEIDRMRAAAEKRVQGRLKSGTSNYRL